MNYSGWKPEQLEQELKKTIIGQDRYIHDLATCLWLHNQRCEHFLRTGELISRPKYNMLVIGKSGMGKTSTIEAACGDGNSRLRLQTDNLLFIAVGAFDGLDEIISKRVQPKRIGFSTQSETVSFEKNLLQQVTPSDLAAYGVSQQFLGRLPIITVMNELEVADYEKILLDSAISPVLQLNNLMKQEQNAEITISQEAAKKLAQKVKATTLGARALQGEVMSLLKDTLYSLQEDTEHAGYCIDYDEDFLIRALPGERKPLRGKKKVSFRLTEEERKCIKQVDLDFIWEEGDSIRTYAEDMFEPFETQDFGENPSQGLVDLYDYVTIRKAQFFMAAVITEMILASKFEGKKKNMMTLLNILRLFYPQDVTENMHPLEKWRDDFIERSHIKNPRELNKIREIAWEVARKHGMYLYETSLDDWECIS